jgi:hypothetical protein
MKTTKKYLVQERYRHCDAWLTIAAFRRFSKATEYADRHFINKTQDDPENPCPCLSCRDGWKAINPYNYETKVTNKKEKTK